MKHYVLKTVSRGNFMVTKTTKIFIIGNILTMAIVIQVIMYGGLFKSIKNDAKMINELGEIRGQVQRVVKLELAYNKPSYNRETIDNLIDPYLKNSLGTRRSHLILSEHMNLIKEEWQDLELLLDKHHKESGLESMEVIIDKSEKIWQIADKTVFQAQQISEKKTTHFKFFILSFGVNVLGIIITLFVFKQGIYDDLKISAIHDPLTKVFNRRYFEEYIENEILRSKRKEKVFSLMMIDIDFFKRINDTYGHAKGDDVLKEFVLIVRESIRGYDVLARIGGEEFVVLLPDTKIDDSINLAERIRIGIQNHKFEGIPPITISLGLVEFRKDDNSNSVLERADATMYKAKTSGRNRIEIG